MATDHREKLAAIKRFDQLITYLRDEMGWPIEKDNFEELTFEYSADELGIDPKTAAKIESIKRLRPLSIRQPWGIFFVKFEPKKLPVMALRRILSQVALKKRASANSAERTAWAADDLLFVSNYGESDERRISFAHFSKASDGHDLPTLKVLGWDNLDTALHLDAVARELSEHLSWPEDDSDLEAWRSRWRAAFTLRNREVITTSKELSIRLAELARAIRDRIKSALAIETERGPLTKLMKAFQVSLVHDLDVDGFADMYAQTISYGLLTARIADPHSKTVDDFASHMRTNPFLRELMETFLKVGGRRGKAGGPGIDYDELGVSEVVELLDDANMEAVVRDFGDKNPQEDPVIHFYELFLSAYNKQLKIQRGVFYTPRPVVSYIVRSVDELLRTEFGLDDGLADITTWGEMVNKHPGLELPPLTDEPGEKRTISPDESFIQILDPATGTGTFLVEVIDIIYKTLSAKWIAQGHSEKKIAALWNEYVPKHLLPRLHAYELLMAPYAIAHLKIGLKLYETGYHFGIEERARIYLTNALEPWVRQLPLIGFDALAHEAAAVNEIKRHKRFTVVIGNPPYNSVSSNRIPWSDQLIEIFKKTVRHEETQIQVLSDDYIRFIARGDFEIRSSHLGILAFITNNNYTKGRVFRDLRHELLSTYNEIIILDLHGNSRLKETAPDGERDENVFDIVQGVGIGVFIAPPSPKLEHIVLRADIWGSRTEKDQRLSIINRTDSCFHSIRPKPPFYMFFPDDESLSAEYERYVPLPSLFGSGNFQIDKTKYYGTGFKSQQDDFAIAFTKPEIQSKVNILLSPSQTESKLRKLFSLCTSSQWNFTTARDELARDDWHSLITKCLYRPFDYRWSVFHRGIISNLRVETMMNLFRPGGLALCTMRGTRSRWQNHALISSMIVSKDAVSLLDMCFVFPTTRVVSDDSFLIGKGGRESNLNQRLVSGWSRKLNWAASDIVEEFEPQVIYYIYSILYSASYQLRYNDLLQKDFPRIPLTENLELFRTLTQLGVELVVLHLLESPILNQPISEFIGNRNPEVEKVSWSKKTVWVDKAETTGFKGVREDVWNFQIGGYQVCEKWLKDRKGRKLLKTDIDHYQKIVVALSETIRLIKKIDEVIEKHGGWPGAFPTATQPVSQQDGLFTTVSKGMHEGKV
jgi:predicted helicase